jgi:hypothetical protein
VNPWDILVGVDFSGLLAGGVKSPLLLSLLHVHPRCFYVTKGGTAPLACSPAVEFQQLPRLGGDVWRWWPPSTSRAFSCVQAYWTSQPRVCKASGIECQPLWPISNPCAPTVLNMHDVRLGKQRAGGNCSFTLAKSRLHTVQRLSLVRNEYPCELLPGEWEFSNGNDGGLLISAPPETRSEKHSWLQIVVRSPGERCTKYRGEPCSQKLKASLLPRALDLRIMVTWCRGKSTDTPQQRQLRCNPVRNPLEPQGATSSFSCFWALCMPRLRSTDSWVFLLRDIIS